MLFITPILFIIGIFSTSMSLIMIIPMIVDFINNDINWQSFAISSAIIGFLGSLLTIANRPSKPIKLSISQAFLLTSSSWLIISALSAMPFIFSNVTTTYTDCFFEAISGITTTGASVITGLDFISSGLLLWRAFLQWLGGVGIIVMALTILPILRIGGMQLFRSESSDRSEKILPRVSQISTAIFSVYILLTIICLIAFWLAGMTFLEATCHALAAISSGGFSTADTSISFFNSALIEFICIIFMTISGMTLILWVRFFQGNFSSILRDSQIKTYFLVILFFITIITLWRYIIENINLLTSLRESAFTVISIITTTGFSTSNYNLWSTLPVSMIFTLMLIGGCTGSTSGGIKIFRFQIMFKLAKAQIFQLYQPHGVLVPLYNKYPITESIISSVFCFIFIYGISLFIMVLGLGLFNLDFITCLSGSISALSNIGPGFGDLISPNNNYASLPDGAKWILMFGMIIGRLEFFTIIVLFSPNFWKS